MKVFLFTLLTFLTLQAAEAQVSTITGSVQDEETTRLLHFVFIKDSKYGNSTFSDSLGNFTIALHPDSKISFRIEGYRDTLIAAGKLGQGAQVQLQSAAKVPIETIDLSMPIAVNESGLVAPVLRRNDIVGSRYMFKTFVHGFFTDTLNNQIYSPYYLFDYEKQSGFLLLTADKKHVQELMKDQIKSFTLYDNKDQSYHFEKVPEIDKVHFVQVLAKGRKYRIYKLIKTSFIPSEISHGAMGDRGNPYDEYVDNTDYYLMDVQSKHLEKLSLRKRALKESFANETAKVDKFISDNSGDIDDNYLGKLGDYMNQ